MNQKALVSSLPPAGPQNGPRQALPCSQGAGSTEVFGALDSGPQTQILLTGGAHSYNSIRFHQHTRETAPSRISGLRHEPDTFLSDVALLTGRQRGKEQTADVDLLLQGLEGSPLDKAQKFLNL